MCSEKASPGKIWLLENGRKISLHNMRECCFFAAGEVSLGSSSNRLKVDYWCTTEITTWRMSFREMVNGPSFILSLAFRSATPEKRKRQIRFLQKICWKRSSRTCQRPKSCGQLKANAHWQEAWRGIHLRTRKTEKARETWDTLSRIQNYSWLLHQRGLSENIK